MRSKLLSRRSTQCADYGSSEVNMKCCLECGGKLALQECGDEGEVPFCGECQVFRFPVFSTAISTAIISGFMPLRKG